MWSIAQFRRLAALRRAVARCLKGPCEHTPGRPCTAYFISCLRSHTVADFGADSGAESGVDLGRLTAADAAAHRSHRS